MTVVIKRSRCPVMILISILVAIMSSLLSSVSANVFEIFGNFSINATFNPPYLTRLKEGHNETVNVMVTFQSIGTFSDDSLEKYLNSMNFKYEPEDPAIAWASAYDSSSSDGSPENYTKSTNSTSAFMEKGIAKLGSEEKVYFLNTTFTVGGKFLGKTKIAVRREKNNSKVEKENSAFSKIEESLFNRLKYRVWVIRDNHRMQHIFVGTLSILLIVANVLMGAQLNLKIVGEVLQKPLAPLIGFACQYIFMPLVSYALAKFLFASVGLYNLGLGMFTTGCCPGGGASNGYTVLLDGNIDLSITMTFISTVAALGMMPFWMFALGRHFLVDVSDRHISVPYRNICYSLLILLLPLAAGVCLRRFLPKFADKAKKVLRPFLIFIIVFICTFGVYVNLYMFKLMNWRVLVGGMSLPWIGFTFGLLASLVFRLKTPDIKAIAIETGIQNTGIGIMLLQLSFLQPDADLASVVPVVVAIFTPGPLLLALIAHYILKYKENKEKSKEKEMQDMSTKTDEILALGKEDKNGNLTYDQFHMSNADSATPLFKESNGHILA